MDPIIGTYAVLARESSSLEKILLYVVRSMRRANARDFCQTAYARIFFGRTPGFRGFFGFYPRIYATREILLYVVRSMRRANARDFCQTAYARIFFGRTPGLPGFFWFYPRIYATREILRVIKTIRVTDERPGLLPNSLCPYFFWMHPRISRIIFDAPQNWNFFSGE
jgi:hypothetical protein